VRDLGAVLWSVFFLVAVGRGRILEPIAPERAEDVMEWLHGVAESEPFGVKTTEAPFYRRVGLQSDGDEEATRRRGDHRRPRVRVREPHRRGVPVRIPPGVRR